jgi:ankyrin repeat protein
MNKQQLDSFFDAIESGNLDKISEMIEQQPALVSARSESGRTPLHWVMFCEQEELQMSIASLLLSKGADVHAQDERGWTPLHEAAYNSTPKIVAFLLSHGAEVNVKDKRGMTPLELAEADKFADTVKVLITHGSNSESQAL